MVMIPEKEPCNISAAKKDCVPFLDTEFSKES
jgi:hypothetical protein